MRVSNALSIIAIFILTGCTAVLLPPSLIQIPVTLSASTPFVAFPYEGEKDIEVNRGDKFLVQNIRYAEKVRLVNSYMDQNHSKKNYFPAGTELFSIHYGESEAYVSLGMSSGVRRYKAFCGLTKRASSFTRLMGGAKVGDALLCFSDIDRDGKFDHVTVAVGASKNPVTVFELRDEFSKIEPLEYTRIKPDEAKSDGMIWLETTTKILGKDFVSTYIGNSFGKEKLSRGTVIRRKNLPQKMNLSGIKITISRDVGGMTAIHIDNAMPPQSTFSYHKTVTMTYR